MHIDFSECHNKQQVMEQQAEYSVSIDSLIEFCYTELNLSKEQLNSLHEWRAEESERLGRLARQRLNQLGFTYHVKPEVL